MNFFRDWKELMSKVRKIRNAIFVKDFLLCISMFCNGILS